MSFTLKVPRSVFGPGIKFKEGEAIEWGKKSLKEKLEKLESVDIAASLGILAKDIFKYLKVTIGQRLNRGELIAEKKSFFKKRDLLAHEEGEVKSVDHTLGTLTYAVEHIIEVPFALQGEFMKKDADFVYIKVKEGTEYALNFSAEKTVGGECRYIFKDTDVTLENCVGKIVVSNSKSTIDEAKVYALEPYALVSYKVLYHNPHLPQIVLQDKEEWANLNAKRWQMCLCIQDSKQVYFYNP